MRADAKALDRRDEDVQLRYDPNREETKAAYAFSVVSSQAGTASYLVLSEMPRADAFTVTAAGDRLRVFAILSRPRFAFAMVLSVFRSSFDHNTRAAFFFFAITTPLQWAHVLRAEANPVKEH
ncbi:hypothetical protein [Bradyrhizobium sp. Ai1a-2]|uniref:hypothetical protein n=1 Tax=Bradyrhizobium sp. Ai1a-2 TaxID=196490 RepID=UPI000480ECA7|nr:hypothetical protein [Bradyrhizobium sp. Ai1a-2]